MESKQAKTPPISKDTKLLCFDLESNSLHGEVFAVGAVVMNSNGEVLDQFTGRCKIKEQVDDWVQHNVIPAIEEMPVTHGGYKEIREAFWRWYVLAEPKVDYVLVSNGYPVEYRFLIKCQEENLKERFWQHPFPILDLFSLLIQANVDSTSKKKIKDQIIASKGFNRHHPLHDATTSALLAFEAFKLTGKL